MSFGSKWASLFTYEAFTTMTHVAVVFTPTDSNLFINGTSVNNSDGITEAEDPYTDFYVQASGGGDEDTITYYCDELRCANCAKWTSNFTPPTAPYSR